MARTLGIIIGIVFILVGILGFFQNPLVSDNGIFVVDAQHNWVHIITGVIIALIAVASGDMIGVTLKVIGVIYILLAALGFLMAPQGGEMLGVMMNAADHWLHLVLGVLILAVGAWAKNESFAASAIA